MKNIKSENIKDYIHKIDSYLKGMSTVPSRNDSYLKETIVYKVVPTSDLLDKSDID